MNESILDKPQDGLCPEIWEKQPDGSWAMHDDVRQKLIALAVSVLESAHLPTHNIILRLTGSLTSNSYTPSSDVDVHISGFRVREFQEMT